MSQAKTNSDLSLADTSASPSTVISLENSQPEVKCPFDIDSFINCVKGQDLSNPFEVLRFLQQKIVLGGALDLHSVEETVEGETNYITVDREIIIESTFSELEYINDFRVTLKVVFMGEESVDLGGPRKEWIRMMNQAIKEKYFEHGLKPLLS